MCWSASKGERGYGKDLVAGSDRAVTVYKVVMRRGRHLVPYFFTGTEKYATVYNDRGVVPSDILFETEMKVENFGDIEIDACSVAYHSYEADRKIEVTGAEFQSPQLHLGLHRYDMTFNGSFYLLKCVIPAGTKYRVNVRGEVISEKLQVIGGKEVLYDRFKAELSEDNSMTIEKLYDIL